MREYTKEWLEELCNNSYSYAEVLRKAGRKQGGGTQATLRKKIEEFQIDTTHFTGQRWQQSPNQTQKTSREKYTLEEVKAMKKNPSLGKIYTNVDDMMKELLN